MAISRTRGVLRGSVHHTSAGSFRTLKSSRVKFHRRKSRCTCRDYIVPGILSFPRVDVYLEFQRIDQSISTIIRVSRVFNSEKSTFLAQCHRVEFPLRARECTARTNPPSRRPPRNTFTFIPTFLFEKISCSVVNSISIHHLASSVWLKAPVQRGPSANAFYDFFVATR